MTSNAGLRDSEEQLRLATEAADVGLWDLDTATDTLYWPARVKAMFGISADSPVSMADYYSGLHPDDRDGTLAAFAAALDPKRRAVYDVEYRTVGKEDGIVRWVAAKGKAIFEGEAVMPIPARVHFCWIGRQLSWAHAFALLSAAAQAGMDEVVLHHTDELEEGAVLTALRGAHGLHLERIDARACLAEAGARLGLSDALAALYFNLTSPVQRADVLRAAILYLQGGIYLDLDTITVASLRPLLDAPQFVGTEYIVWPHWVRSSRSWTVWAKHLALDALRSGLRLCPGGWRGFQYVESWYFKGVNNAVLGAQAGAPLFAAYLTAMAALPPARRRQPYALGPDLLQSLTGQFSSADLVVHEPGVFYPLAPEISTHWFRAGAANLDLALRPQTRVVHWYASVRSKPYIALIDPDYVRAHRQTQLYSALVSRVLPHL